MKKFVFYVVSIVILIFGEILVSKFSVLGLLFVIFTGLYRGSATGSTVGFVIGIIEGVFFTTSFGVLSFCYAIIGYLAGRIPKRIDENNTIVIVALAFLAAIISKIISLVVEMIFSPSILNVFPGRAGFTGTVGTIGFNWTVIFLVFTPVFFWVFKKWYLVWFRKLDVER
ncbi:MAG: rod shape-determining protein MreD [Elusimicrobiota bacterium]